MANDDDFTSFAHAIFASHRDAFETELRRFLTSPSTPAQARRVEAEATIQRLTDIVARLRGQGVM